MQFCSLQLVVKGGVGQNELGHLHSQASYFKTHFQHLIMQIFIVFNDTTWASELRIVNGQGQAVRLNGVDVTCSSAFWRDVHTLIEETHS